MVYATLYVTLQVAFKVGMLAVAVDCLVALHLLCISATRSKLIGADVSSFVFSASTRAPRRSNR